MELSPAGIKLKASPYMAVWILGIEKLVSFHYQCQMWQVACHNIGVICLKPKYIWVCDK